MQENLDKNGKIDIIFGGISSERMSTYMEAASNNKEKALNLYNKNTKTSELFYTPLQGFEVLLRNTVYTAISEIYGENWLFEDRFPFEYIQKKMINNVLDKKITVHSSPKLIAELSFGFWTSLFGRKYEEIWRHNLRKIFKGHVKPLTRKEIFTRLNEIRELRNRIAHHEPIIFKRDKFEDLKTILEMAGYICPVTAEWIEKESKLKIPKEPRNPCPKEIFDELEGKQFSLAIALSYLKMAYYEEGPYASELAKILNETYHGNVHLMVYNALHTFIVVEIIKLFDNSSQSNTLLTILKAIKKENDEDKALLARIQKQFVDLESAPEFKKVRDARNKMIAHNAIESEKYSYSDIEEVYKKIVPIFEDIFEYLNDDGFATSKNVLAQTDRIANGYIINILKAFTQPNSENSDHDKK
ncbi:MAG: Abi family protein [Simkaniaceae bacterium]|nr:Abi family protein [Legionellales bacterium]NRA89603.1 Abi family protein [Simkaniaceae bacterium]